MSLCDRQSLLLGDSLWVADNAVIPYACLGLAL